MEWRDGVLVWGASQIEEATVEQAQRTARLPFVREPLALMPDAHVGIGATVGSVAFMEGAIVPAAVGVDIGCGMIAARTNLSTHQLPDDLAPLLALIEQRIPAGVGQSHAEAQNDLPETVGMPASEIGPREAAKVTQQFGTLGSGNHFLEVCLDEDERVWIVLHSGSRGIGNNLAERHIEGAKSLMRRYFIDLEDPNLAYVAEGTAEFDAYIADMLWAQRYAAGQPGQDDDGRHGLVDRGDERRHHRARADQLPPQLRRPRASAWPRRMGYPQGRHPCPARRPGRHSRIHGDLELHRDRARQPGKLRLVLARGGASPVADRCSTPSSRPSLSGWPCAERPGSQTRPRHLSTSIPSRTRTSRR